jgi:GNAT superfamily N-acetyltransferase
MPQIRCARFIDAPFRTRIWCRSRRPSVTACVTMSCEMPSLQPEPDQRRATRVWHLAMARRDQLRAARDPGRDVRVEVAQVPFGPLNRFFYLEIGSEFHWVDRRGWTGARWQRHAVGVTTWLVHDHGTPAGYAELQRRPDVSIDVAFFGLLAPFRGRGLGGHLLTRAVGDAWDMGARRVTVNTCELDGPYALSHYRARGFEIVRERIEERPVLF